MLTANRLVALAKSELTEVRVHKARVFPRFAELRERVRTATECAEFERLLQALVQLDVWERGLLMTIENPDPVEP
jgi:hypothetical protein